MCKYAAYLSGWPHPYFPGGGLHNFIFFYRLITQHISVAFVTQSCVGEKRSLVAKVSLMTDGTDTLTSWLDDI